MIRNKQIAEALGSYVNLCEISEFQQWPFGKVSIARFMTPDFVQFSL